MDTLLLGSNIRKARRDKNLSGDKLSELCSVTPAYLRQLEAGSKTPSLTLFVSLCNQLNVSPSYLLNGVADRSVDFTIEELDLLCKTAKPSQLKLVIGMIKAALDQCDHLDHT